MNGIILAALLGCLYVVSAAAEPKLAGHFASAPFNGLYELLGKGSTPSPSRCFNFLSGTFKRDGYKVLYLEDLVLVDACLGFIFEGTSHEQDSIDDPEVRHKVPMLQNDAELKKVYYGTKIDEYSEKGRSCIANLLSGVTVASRKLKDNFCTNELATVYLDFADCQVDSIPAEARTDDSYLRLIYPIVQRWGAGCYSDRLTSLDGARYTSSYRIPLNNPFVTFSFNKYVTDYLWPKNIDTLFRAVQGVSHAKDINMEEIGEMFEGVSHQDEASVSKLMRNLAYYADKTINPKEDSDTQADPSGEQRYRAAVDKMCSLYGEIPADMVAQVQKVEYAFRPGIGKTGPIKTRVQKFWYDYTTSAKVLGRTIEHSDLFGVSREKFNKVMEHELLALYLSIAGCDILSHTEAHLHKDPRGFLTYQLTLKPAAGKIAPWLSGN